jgi:hypothetical protein
MLMARRGSEPGIGGEDRAPLVIALLLIAIMLPEAFGFFVGDFRITPARVALLALAPVMLFGFARLVATHGYRFVVSDLLIPVLMVWMIVAPAHVQEWDVGWKSGGLNALELGGPYLATRSLLRTSAEMHGVVRLFCSLAAITGVLGIIDAVAGYPVLRDGIARFTGYTYAHPPLDPSIYDRFGITRAMSVYEHPIMFGITMCYALMLCGDLQGRRRLWCRLGCGVGLLLSFSAAPWQGCAIGFGLLLYGRIFRFQYRWVFLLVLIGVVLSLFFLVMSNPWGWIFNHLTLDAGTGYDRLLIWHYAGGQVLRSPVFGAGLGEDWFRPEWMSASVDSFWLRMAMEFGIPGAALAGLALVGAATIRVRPGEGFAATFRDAALAERLGIVLALAVFLGFTVHFWGVTSMLIGLMAGMRVSLGQGAARGMKPVDPIWQPTNVTRLASAREPLSSVEG